MDDAARTSGMRGSRALWVARLLAVALLVLAFLATFSWLRLRWDRPGGYYSHGWLVPPIGLGLVYLRRKDLLAAPVRPCPQGLLLLLPCLLMHLLGTAWQIGFLSGFALVGAIAGLVLSLFGPAVLAVVWFPIAFLLFMVPVPGLVIEKMSFSLKLLAARVAAVVLGVLGLPAVQQGSYIRIPEGTVVVDDVCSGLKYLIALAAFGAVYAYVSPLKRSLKLALLVISLPVAFVANVTRVLLMVLVAYAFGLAATDRWYFHDLFGFALFAAAFVMLFLAESLLLGEFRHRRSGNQPEPGAAAGGLEATANEETAGRAVAASGASSVWRTAATHAAALCVLALTAAGTAYLGGRAVASPTSPTTSSFPLQLGMWTGRDFPLTDHEYELLGTRDVLSRIYDDGMGGQIQLVVVVAHQMRRRTHPPELCFKGEGYSVRGAADRAVSLEGASDRGSVEVRELVLEGPHGARIAWYFYKSGAHLTTSYWRHQAGVAMRRLRDPSGADVLIRVDKRIDKADPDEVRAQLGAFLARAFPSIESHLP